MVNLTSAPISAPPQDINPLASLQSSSEFPLNLIVHISFLFSLHPFPVVPLLTLLLLLLLLIAFILLPCLLALHLPGALPLHAPP